MRTLWVLNLDADLELAAYPKPYVPSPRTRTLGTQWAARLGDLVGDGEVLEVSDAAPGPRNIRSSDKPLRGCAFCPTPWAMARLEAAGARAHGPPPSVLRAANDRALSSPLVPKSLGDGLGSVYCVDVPSIERALRRAAARPWLLKSAFGFAGRGQLRLRPGEWSASARARVTELLAMGGMEVVPWVPIALEASLHGYLHADGDAVTWGEPTVQRCHPATGAWQESVRAQPSELSAQERSALEDAAARAADRLRAVGYFGPFGIDAFREETGAFCSLSEINARYTMGYAVGMGAPLAQALANGSA